MVSKNERELVVKYALENENNLEIALKIALSFDEIRKKVILGFLDALEKALRESLGDEWMIENSLKEDVFERWSGIHIHKKEWEEKYYIGIESQYYGAKGFIIGVSKKEDLAPIHEGKLKNLLDENYKPGKASESWEWYQRVDGIYENWDNEDVLLEMYRKNEAVNYFKEYLLRIREMATPVIDRAVESR